MYRRIEDALEAYEELSGGTSRILDALTDESLDTAVARGHRTIGRIAWHIVVTIPEMMNRTGLGLSSVDEEAPPPERAAEIADAYRTAAGELKEALGGWSDETLLETDDMYGEIWPRGRSLSALMIHEAHHRGQLTVLMRQAGLAVPGALGPSKEEWARWAMEPPEV